MPVKSSAVEITYGCHTVSQLSRPFSDMAMKYVTSAINGIKAKIVMVLH